MNRFTKFVAGAATAAVMSVSLAAPADAQYRDYRYRDRGIGAGDIISGVAILGGIAAITSAFDRDGSRYGYGNRYRYRDNYRDAVNACGYEAERSGRGRVSVTEVDRRGDGYRVRGVIDNDDRFDRYGRNDRYDRYDRSGRYDRYDRSDRYDRYDRSDRYDRYDRSDRSDRYSRNEARVAFTCRTDGYGRVRDYNVNRYRW